MRNIRLALLWAGLMTLSFTLAGCPEKGGNTPDGSCNACPCNMALCTVDGGMDADMGHDSGNTCTPVPENSSVLGRCSNGVDDDCDGYIDANDTGCSSVCTPVAEDTRSCLTGIDNDCDSKIGSVDPDCALPICHPGTDYNADPNDDYHGATLAYCHDYSWQNDLLTDQFGDQAMVSQILGRATNFNCCPVSGVGACKSLNLAYSDPNASGLEPFMSWPDQAFSLVAELGPNGERLEVNRVYNKYTIVLSNGTLQRGTLAGNTLTPEENCN